jgi:hypothetical protein
MTLFITYYFFKFRHRITPLATPQHVSNLQTITSF